MRRRSKDRSSSPKRESLPTPSSSHESIAPRNPAISRILFSDTPRKRENGESYSDLSRAVSLASFYSEADSEGTNGFLTCEEAWYSQTESTDYATDDDAEPHSHFRDAESGDDSALETSSIGSPGGSSPMSSSEKLADQAKRYGPIVLGLGNVEKEARRHMLDVGSNDDADSVEGGSGTGASGSGDEAAAEDLVTPTPSAEFRSGSPALVDAMEVSNGGLGLGLGAASTSVVNLPVAAR